MRIYFSGVGGVAIGPLARIARDAGYDIVGSDMSHSLVTDELEDQGISVFYDQSGEALCREHEAAPIDWFIHTSALPADHPELLEAQKLGIKTAKRDELLAKIITEKNLKLIAAAGTHGKTTTTGMLVWTMKQLGISVSYSVGTTLSWGPSGVYDPKSEYFVYECDEFDRNFLHFQPYASLVTNIDYDHPDTYPNEADYFSAFEQFIEQSGHVVLWKNDAEHVRIPKSAWALAENEVEKLALAGEHNRHNATLAYKTLEFLGILEKYGKDRVCKVIESFPGTNRRFEKLAENLYTDYGHHPNEIAATLQLAREILKNVVLVYQPHQNVRQHEVRELYTDCMEDAETIYWLPTYLSREDPSLEILRPEDLTNNLTNKSSVVFGELNDELWSHIQIELHKGRLVLCMGAGSIDSWLREKLYASDYHRYRQ